MATKKPGNLSWRGSPIIRHIVGRCHVGESNLAVIRYVLSRLKPGGFRKLPRASRRGLLQEIIKVHAANRRLYSAVMSGRL